MPARPRPSGSASAPPTCRPSASVRCTSCVDSAAARASPGLASTAASGSAALPLSTSLRVGMAILLVLARAARTGRRLGPGFDIGGRPRGACAGRSPSANGTPETAGGVHDVPSCRGTMRAAPLHRTPASSRGHAGCSMPESGGVLGYGPGSGSDRQSLAITTEGAEVKASLVAGIRRVEHAAVDESNTIGFLGEESARVQHAVDGP